ncbi:Coenzyme F420 hydrogenase/dehydrogenase, beta subunit C-terminal domain [Shimia sp.]|uniref:Coenzyme F420 hydrogenase/dehydrogenase, beta subunit C-terminal domain n=1 Tax=Shimia sp. TaxID=1954381 RepID=UPI00329A733A
MNGDPITSVVARNQCTGCGACAGAFPEFIKMVEDATHGRRPLVTRSEAGCQASRDATAVCAGQGSNWTQLRLGDEIDEAWGPVRAAWEGWAEDPEIRYRGSSGGAVTGLGLFALETGFAGGVVHVAARQDDLRLNETVISHDRAGLMRGAGSRYAQASPCDALARIKAGDEKVVFVGKPCDVASVSKAMRHDPELAEKISLTIAIFCAGAPNLVATDALLKSLGVPKGATIRDLRYRGNGWPGLMQATWVGSDGQETKSNGIPYGAGWGGILQSHRRWRCRVCADHSGAFADISVGDPWHAPPSGNEDAGRSLVVARTARGQAFVEAARRSQSIYVETRPRDVIARAQPNLSATNGAVWGRRMAMRMFGLGAPQDRGQKLLAQWWALPMKQKALSVLGTWKRILRDRLWQPVRISGRTQ